MNEPVSAPTLLTLTAPEPPRESIPSGFDDDLATAAESRTREASEEVAPEVSRGEDEEQRAADQPESDAVESEVVAEEEVDQPAAAESEEAPETTNDVDVSELIAVVIASDAETPPQSVSPGIAPGGASGDQQPQAPVTSPAAPANPGESPAVPSEDGLEPSALDGASPEGRAQAGGDRRTPSPASDSSLGQEQTANPALEAAGDSGAAAVGDAGDPALSAATTGAADEPVAAESKRLSSSPGVAVRAASASEAEPTSSQPQTEQSRFEAAAPSGRRVETSAAVEAVSAAEVSASTGAATSPEAASEGITPIADRGEASTIEADRPAAESARGASRAQPVDAARFVSRVSRAFEAAQDRGGGPVQIRLSPPELGTLQVRLEVTDGVMTASVETETQAARSVLLENLPALRDRLAEQQIRVEQFDVDVRDDSRHQPEDRGGDPQADRGAEQEERDGVGPRRTPPSAAADESQHQPSTIRFDDDGVDLVA